MIKSNYNYKLAVDDLLQFGGGFSDKKISMGEHHTILFNNTSLFGIGSNVNGQLGLDNLDEIKTLTQLPLKLEEDEDISNVVTGYYHTAVLTNKNIWVCGNNHMNQLDISLNKEIRIFTKSIQIDMLPASVNKIFSSGYTLFLCLDNKEIYVSGTYPSTHVVDELYLGNSIGPFTNLILPFTETIISYGFSDDYYILLTATKIYKIGSNISGQIGLGYINHSYRFIADDNDKNYIKIVCNIASSYLISLDSKVYVTGSNNKGQLGLGNNKDIDEFTYNDKLDGILELYSVGSFVVAKKSNGIFGFGSNKFGELALPANPKGTYPSPTLITTTIDYGSIVVGYSGLIIRELDYLMVSGNNFDNQLFMSKKDKYFSLHKIEYSEPIIPPKYAKIKTQSDVFYPLIHSESYQNKTNINLVNDNDTVYYTNFDSIYVSGIQYESFNTFTITVNSTLDYFSKSYTQPNNIFIHYIHKGTNVLTPSHFRIIVSASGLYFQGLFHLYQSSYFQSELDLWHNKFIDTNVLHNNNKLDNNFISEVFSIENNIFITTTAVQGNKLCNGLYTIGSTDITLLSSRFSQNKLKKIGTPIESFYVDHFEEQHMIIYNSETAFVLGHGFAMGVISQSTNGNLKLFEHSHMWIDVLSNCNEFTQIELPIVNIKQIKLGLDGHIICTENDIWVSSSYFGISNISLYSRLIYELPINQLFPSVVEKCTLYAFLQNTIFAKINTHTNELLVYDFHTENKEAIEKMYENRDKIYIVTNSRIMMSTPESSISNKISFKPPIFYTAEQSNIKIPNINNIFNTNFIKFERDFIQILELIKSNIIIENIYSPTGISSYCISEDKAFEYILDMNVVRDVNTVHINKNIMPDTPAMRDFKKTNIVHYFSEITSHIKLYFQNPTNTHLKKPMLELHVVATQYKTALASEIKNSQLVKQFLSKYSYGLYEDDLVSVVNNPTDTSIAIKLNLLSNKHDKITITVIKFSYNDLTNQKDDYIHDYVYNSRFRKISSFLDILKYFYRNAQNELGKGVNKYTIKFAIAINMLLINGLDLMYYTNLSNYTPTKIADYLENFKQFITSEFKSIKNLLNRFPFKIFPSTSKNYSITHLTFDMINVGYTRNQGINVHINDFLRILNKEAILSIIKHKTPSSTIQPEKKLNYKPSHETKKQHQKFINSIDTEGFFNSTQHNDFITKHLITNIFSDEDTLNLICHTHLGSTYVISRYINEIIKITNKFNEQMKVDTTLQNPTDFVVYYSSKYFMLGNVQSFDYTQLKKEMVHIIPHLMHTSVTQQFLANEVFMSYHYIITVPKNQPYILSTSTPHTVNLPFGSQLKVNKISYAYTTTSLKRFNVIYCTYLGPAAGINSADELVKTYQNIYKINKLKYLTSNQLNELVT